MKEYIIYKVEPIEYEPAFQVEVYRSPSRDYALSKLEQLTENPEPPLFDENHVFYMLKIE